jgi:hypothetical protein
MITIKQVERDERTIKNIHPRILFLSILFGTIVILLLSKTISLILYDSYGVGSFIIGDFTKGLIISCQIVTLEIIINISYLISIIQSFIIVALIYIIFKEYLKYNKDNL